MPWLSSPDSNGSNGSPNISPGQNNHKHPVKSRNVAFIPAQIDGLCGTSPSHNSQTPMQLLMADLRILMQNIRCIPSMTRTMCSPKVLQNSLGATAGVRDVIIHCSLAIMQVCMVFLALPMFVLLPGFIYTACMTMCWAIMALMLQPLKGSRIVTSSRDCLPAMREDFSDERWIFVNSVACSHRTLTLHCNRLSRTFSRRVTGVHNASNGLIIDVFEALLQRAFSFPTPCTSALTSQLRDACLNSSVRKVIVMGHGTGGIAISQALDRLHADLPVDVLSKLEIYTFGSAAAHLGNPALRMEPLNNGSGNDSTSPGGHSDKYTRPNGSIASPVKTALGTLGHRIEDRERVIPHIEHYALSSDIFARCGVLNAVKNKLDSRFCGRVFIIDDAKISASSYPSSMAGRRGGGFLFDEHYLDLLFPELERNGEAMDQIVEVDIATAEKREFTAQGVALPLKALNLSPMMMGPTNGLGLGIGSLAGMASINGAGTPRESPNGSPRPRKYSPSERRSGSWGSDRSVSGGSISGNGNGNGNGAVNNNGNGRSEKRRSWGTAETMGIDCVGRARTGAKECEGRTVRQLSRLWRFGRGGRPVGEGVPFANGVGHAGGNGMSMM